MKASAIIRIIICSIVACLLTAVLCIGLTGDISNVSFGIIDAFRYPDADRYEMGNGETDAAIHTVEIHWVSGQVNILSTEDTAIRWEETCSVPLQDNWRVRYLVDNGVLHLQFRENALFHIGSTPQKELTVYLPSSLSLGKIAVENVSGNIHLEELTVTNADLETVSGNIQIEGLQSNSLDISTVSGEMQAEQVEATAIDMESVSGNARIAGTVDRWNFESVSGEGELITDICPQEVDADTVSGNITLTIPDNDGFTVQADGLDKHFQCDFPMTTVDDDTWKYKNGAADFAFDSVSGKARIIKAAN